jgi:hypothetical protein
MSLVNAFGSRLLKTRDLDLLLESETKWSGEWVPRTPCVNGAIAVCGWLGLSLERGCGPSGTVVTRHRRLLLRVCILIVGPNIHRRLSAVIYIPMQIVYNTHGGTDRRVKKEAVLDSRRISLSCQDTWRSGELPRGHVVRETKSLVITELSDCRTTPWYSPRTACNQGGVSSTRLAIIWSVVLPCVQQSEINACAGSSAEKVARTRIADRLVSVD